MSLREESKHEQMRKRGHLGISACSLHIPEESSPRSLVAQWQQPGALSCEWTQFSKRGAVDILKR